MDPRVNFKNEVFRGLFPNAFPQIVPMIKGVHGRAATIQAYRDHFIPGRHPIVIES